MAFILWETSNISCWYSDNALDVTTCVTQNSHSHTRHTTQMSYICVLENNHCAMASMHNPQVCGTFQCVVWCCQCSWKPNLTQCDISEWKIWDTKSQHEFPKKRMVDYIGKLVRSIFLNVWERLVQSYKLQHNGPTTTSTFHHVFFS